MRGRRGAGPGKRNGRGSETFTNPSACIAAIPMRGRSRLVWKTTKRGSQRGLNLALNLYSDSIWNQRRGRSAAPASSAAPARRRACREPLLGHTDSVVHQDFPVADPAYVVDETVTCVVQIKGKVRARLEISPSITDEELEALALADEAVVAALGGAGIRKVIVRAPKLVNIVPA
ncbi:hypothetical protein SBADM41S_10089 [Streptomyces badius]